MSRKRKQQSRRPTSGWRGRGRGVGARGGLGGEGPAPSADPAEQAARDLGLLASQPQAAAVAAARRRLGDLPSGVVADAARPLVELFVTTAWTGGWQPSELVWHVRRVGGGAASTLVVGAVAADAVPHRRRDVHPRWADQLAELGIELSDGAGDDPGGSASPGPGWLRDAAEGVADPIGALCDLVVLLGVLPRLQVLIPVPGRPDIALDVVGSDGVAGTEGIDPGVLAKVRALLAKAEATTFEAEAQAFTAKAHELMTRHSVEHAVVTRSTDRRRARPLARRLLIDDPYADAKGLLVQVIAEASRCQAVSHQSVQMSTVVGFESDLAAVEVLFTSLLVQAQTGLQELARHSAAGSRERSRGFRSSFLRGFAHRIGERLEAAGEATVDDVDRESGGALVPVLAERAAEVEDHLSEMFPHVVSRVGARPTDVLGFRAGSDAAERADLPWAQVTS